MKPSFVVISSSSDDDNQSNSDYEEEELESSENDSVYSESDDPEYDHSEESDIKYSDEEQCFDNPDNNRGSNDLLRLSHDECKDYLRKHQLRLSGTKEECIQRIKEHGRLKDGRGELLYPRSSFSINCTGDACKGDAVLFRQKTFKKQGNIVRQRTVAGRIVKESYGSSKQQHTFTVEVLWSKPFKSLPPLFPLLVKGRNLYRLGTYRQPWNNEAERLKVLGEKHTRGDAARHTRKQRQTGFASDSDKCIDKLNILLLFFCMQYVHNQFVQGDTARHTRKRRHTEFASNNDKGGAARHNTRKRRQTEFASNNDKGGKRRKLSNGGSSQAKNKTRIDKNKSVKRQAAAPVTKNIAHNKSQKMKFKTSKQPTFNGASSSSLMPYDRTLFPYDRTSLPNLPPLPVGFSSYGPYNNGQPRHSNVHSQPSGYHHYNYGQPGPRHRFG